MAFFFCIPQVFGRCFADGFFEVVVKGLQIVEADAFGDLGGGQCDRRSLSFRLTREGFFALPILFILPWGDAVAALEHFGKKADVLVSDGICRLRGGKTVVAQQCGGGAEPLADKIRLRRGADHLFETARKIGALQVKLLGKVADGERTCIFRVDIVFGNAHFAFHFGLALLCV